MEAISSKRLRSRSSNKMHWILKVLRYVCERLWSLWFLLCHWLLLCLDRSHEIKLKFIREFAERVQVIFWWFLGLNIIDFCDRIPLILNQKLLCWSNSWSHNDKLYDLLFHNDKNHYINKLVLFRKRLLIALEVMLSFR